MNELDSAIAEYDLAQTPASPLPPDAEMPEEPLDIPNFLRKWPDLPDDIFEWIQHLNLHVTEHDERHAGLALRAAWPQVRDYYEQRLQSAEALAARMAEALRQILCEAEEREDIEDGEGGPLPNIWMRIAEEIREVLPQDTARRESDGKK